VVLDMTQITSRRVEGLHHKDTGSITGVAGDGLTGFRSLTGFRWTMSSFEL
jgi:hypothetical protein